MRQTRKHLIDNIEIFKTQLLAWSQQFDDVVWLDSNHCKQKYSKYDAVLAVDAFTSIQTDYSNGFNKLKDYQLSPASMVNMHLMSNNKKDFLTNLLEKFEVY